MNRYTLTLTKEQLDVLRTILDTAIESPPVGAPVAGTGRTFATRKRSAAKWPEWIEKDGGRAAAGYKGKSGDCVTRAWAIALFGPDPSGDEYQFVYDRFGVLLKTWAFEGRISKAKRKYREGGKTLSARDGMPREVIQRFASEQNFEWVPPKKTPQTPDEAPVHVRPSELPRGVLVLNMSRHLACMIDHVLYDNHDSSISQWVEEDGGRGWRLVSGFWQKAA